MLVTTDNLTLVKGILDRMLASGDIQSLLDGLADGVILNYVECNRRLDPRLHPKTFEHIRCADGGDSGNDCLSFLE